MPSNKISARDAIIKFGGIRKAARALGMPYTTFYDRLTAELAKDPKKTPVKGTNTGKSYFPRTSDVRRFILTSAQSETDVHKPFFENLKAYAKFHDAELLIAGYTYTNQTKFKDDETYKLFDESLRPYMTNSAVNFAGNVVFCAETNISPTAVNPLSGFETYTRSFWGVFPHPRVALRSLSTPFDTPSKQIMTTGTVTVPNYTNTKAGLKARFHHVLGAVILEIAPGGRFFLRHLLASKDGSFQDLGNGVANGKITQNQPVLAINWGDIHFEQHDPLVAQGCWWGPNCMLDTLTPDYQFFHDTLDFKVRNHHNIDDPIFRYKQWLNKDDCVEKSVKDVASFLKMTERDFCTSIVVESNHDIALKKWLKTADYRKDPANAEFFLKCQALNYRLAREKRDSQSFLGHVIEKVIGEDVSQIIFLSETDSFELLPNSDETRIECGLHGHKGANGARPSPTSYQTMGPKANIGHMHTPGIYDGLYVAGTSSKLDMGYNAGGLSSWAHSHIVTYANGKRTILTMCGNRWCA